MLLNSGRSLAAKEDGEFTCGILKLPQQLNSVLTVPVRTTVQPARKGTPPKMVPRLHAKRKEENSTGAGRGHPGQTLQDV